MKNQTDSRIIQRILGNIQEQRKLIMLLSCVVFITTYLLILPAFTLECGKGVNPLPIGDSDIIYRGLRDAMFSCLTAV